MYETFDGPPVTIVMPNGSFKKINSYGRIQYDAPDVAGGYFIDVNDLGAEHNEVFLASHNRIWQDEHNEPDASDA